MLARRYFIWFAYHGARYHGWQAQKNATGIQEVLQTALATLLREPLVVTGQGRTDAGVHARQMVAHFDCLADLPVDLNARLNQLLPQDIRITQIREVTPEAHARYSAEHRLYRYYIHRSPDPFLADRSWYLQSLPDIELLHVAAKMLLQHADFGCFAKTHGGNHTNLCDVTRSEWNIHDHQLIFTIQANRFLRQMVRAVVGSLVALAQGKKNLAWWTTLLLDSPGRKCGLAAPPHGLFLEEVAYPDSIFLNQASSLVMPLAQNHE